MPTIKFEGFDGLIPRLSPTYLGDNFAQVASNVKLYSKELRTWRGPEEVFDPPGSLAYQSLYRLFRTDGDSRFLTWETDVDVAVSPTADASAEARIYYTGDGEPKKTNWAMAVGADPDGPYPVAAMPMGVTPPSVKPTTTVTSAGSGTTENRNYVITWVSDFGSLKAESAPSPVSSPAVTVGATGSIVTVSKVGVPAPEADEAVSAWRIYRTVVGATTASYQFVAEVAIGTNTFADNLTAAQLGEVLPTEGWVGPPADLAGLGVLPGGSLCGFSKNTVYFSEPHYPHAWPVAYGITLPVLKIVGVAVIGSSVAVMTDTQPFFIHGGFPGEMYTEKITIQEPCVAKSTIAADEDGVVYASPNGLVSLSPSTRALVTTNLFTADEWRPLIPQTMKATILQGRYFGVFPNEDPTRALVLSRTDPPALSYIELPAIALHTDARNGLLFYIDDTSHNVVQLDADADNPLTYEWRSKRFWIEHGITFSLLRLDADYAELDASLAEERAAAIAWNEAHWGGGLVDLYGAINAGPIHGMSDPATAPETASWPINGSILRDVPDLSASRMVQVLLYGDDNELLATLNPYTLDPIRIPPFKSRELEVAIIGNISVRNLRLATVMGELFGAQ